MGLLEFNWVGEWPEADQMVVQQALDSLQQLVATEIAGQINLVLSDDATVAKLNEAHGSGLHTTDVLTFNYHEVGAVEDGELADVVISQETADAQAKDAGTDLATELAVLAVHGVLHVLGHDHAIDEDRAKMEALQKQILAESGLTYREFGWK